MITSEAGNAPEAAPEVVREAVGALNRGDVDGYLERCHPDALRWIAELDASLCLADVAVGLHELAAGFTGLQLEEELLFGDATHACARWRLRGVHSATYGGHPASGRPIEVTTCEVYAVEDGRILASWVYGDVLDIFSQIAPATETPARA